MNRRKGTPCACECDPCKGKNSIRAINNVSPDPNGDFNVNAGSGIIISDDENGIIIANGMPDPASLVAGDNIDITPSGTDLVISVSNDINIPGDAVIGGDLTVNGTYYTVHAEHVYTEDDYIIMRDGASTGLGAGDYSGFQVKKYDGVNDGRLVIDNQGTARVGDVGDEEPLLTRDEAADLTDGHILKWDAANYKAVDSGLISNDVIVGTASAGTQKIDHSLVINSNQYFQYQSDASNQGRAYQYLDGTGSRLTFRCDNLTGNVYGMLEIMANSDGTITIRVQKRRKSDDTYLDGTTLATL